MSAPLLVLGMPLFSTVEAKRVLHRIVTGSLCLVVGGETVSPPSLRDLTQIESASNWHASTLWRQQNSLNDGYCLMARARKTALSGMHSTQQASQNAADNY